MKIVRFYIAAVAITIIEFIFNFVCSVNIFRWVFKITPANAWKLMQGPPTMEYYIGTVALNILLVLVYAILSGSIPGEGLKKGFIFGFLVWLIGTLPVMFGAYLFMNMAQEAVLYLTILGLVINLSKGVATALICKK